MRLHPYTSIIISGSICRPLLFSSAASGCHPSFMRFAFALVLLTAAVCVWCTYRHVPFLEHNVPSWSGVSWYSCVFLCVCIYCSLSVLFRWVYMPMFGFMHVHLFMFMCVASCEPLLSTISTCASIAANCNPLSSLTQDLCCLQFC